jgi:glycosyltransferase involved in cell wall biosynthesis
VRILSLSNCLLDANTGSGYVTLGYAHGLRQRGHSVELLGPPEFEPLSGLGRAISYRQTLGMAAISLRRLASASWDVVEFWGGEAWLALALLSRLPRRRFLLVSHSNGLETHSAELLRSAESTGQVGTSRRWFQFEHSPLAARGFKAADALITVGTFDRKYALDMAYAPPHRVVAIDNPLPEEYLGLAVDFARPPIIGYCGSWMPRKGSALLAAALPDVLRALPSWRLVLVGVGSSFRPEDHFPADVLPRVEVVPFAERGGSLRALYQSFSMVVLPSVYESFGLAATEAMACGAALVATRVGFAAGLRDQHEARLLGEATPQALYEALLSLAEDDELRQRIARGGYRRVQSLRWEKAIDTAEASYLRWLAELRTARAQVVTDG